MESDMPGLFFAGQYRDGISVSDCILSGDKTAKRAAEYFGKILPDSKPRFAALRALAPV
jgi:heterodisulfide reductase subunit A-like polyferredoxin